MAKQTPPRNEPTPIDPRERSQPDKSPDSRKGDDTPTRPIRIDLPRHPTAADPDEQVDLDRTAPHEAR